MPRTAGELVALLDHQPPMWEHLAWAGHLAIGVRKLNPKWLDHRMGYPGRGQIFTSAEAAVDHAENALHYMIDIVEQIDYWLSPQMRELAFGRPGSSGDAAVIEHTAHRLLGVYEGCMDWAIDLRSARPPAALSRLFQLAADHANNPVRAFRDFVELTVSEFDKFSAVDWYAQETNIEVSLPFTITGDAELSRQFAAERSRVLASLRRG
ncbi:hypothetical protein EBN88_08440 [Streptomyces triticirhizae]|uniref:Uncharacterized protein n=1 Tax=Streptomyces triticirhizae TaxID=2483353 RepID=A0A3M2M064_9ACTN|nr:hypothetical protein EBN88_08440 [Streptomyces triticirhizae]